MKRLIKIFILSLIALPALATPVAAVNPVEQVCSGGGSGSAACEAADPNEGALLGAEGVVTRAVQFIVYIAGALSVVLVVLGGIKYATSNGDSGNIQSAKNTVIYALVGLIVAVFAQAIVSFVLSRL